MTEAILISDRLRYILFALQCIFQIHFDRKVIDQVFEDSENDITNSKSYTFWIDSKLEIKGFVEDYEPEMIWLTVNSRKLKKEQFDFIIMKSEYDSKVF